MKKETEEPKIFKKACPNCGKKFYSLSEKQLKYNYISHLGSCNPKDDEQKDNHKEQINNKKPLFP